MTDRDKLPILILTTHCVNPWDNLALEEYLMGHCRSDSDEDPERRYSAILFLWQNAHTVVIGRNQNAWAECRTGLLEEEGGFLARRSTGGGAVFHDLGNLNFSIILPRSRFDLGESFRVILDAVRSLGISAVRSGRNDILIDDRKFSGNAFRYFRGVALHHGTLMVDTDVEPLLRYLTVSEIKLRSRAIQSARARVINLIEAKQDLTLAQLSDAVIASFIERYGQGVIVEHVMADDFPRDDRLASLEQQYASWEWRYGHAIDFDAKIETGRFPWGQAELQFKVEQGIITDAVIYSDALDSDFIAQIADALLSSRFTSRDMANRVASLDGDCDTVGEISQKTIRDDMVKVILDQSF
ncbi:MAG: lipoate--protein ligase [Clostridiaceae bacterium]|nr:lipoate--protein ligase [Clostridiaceae bacterium]